MTIFWDSVFLHYIVSFLAVMFLTMVFRPHPGAGWFAFKIVLVIGLGKELQDWVDNNWHMARIDLFYDCVLDMTFNMIGAILGLWCSKEIE